MAEIEQTQMADIVARLPQLVPWNIERFAGHRISLLIVCAGFEKRSLAIVDSLDGIAVEHLLIIEYPTNTADNAIALATLETIAAGRRSRMQYDRSTFLANMSHEIDQIAESEAIEIVVDVSAMASYVMSRVFCAIWNRANSIQMRIFYAEAGEYSPTQAEWDEFFKGVADPEDNLSIAARYEETYFQSRGVEETYECDGFPGHNEGPLATELIAIPSFSLQRVKSMTTFAESRYNVTQRVIRWFLGSPPDKSRNGWRFDAIAKLYNVSSGGIAVDTRDYRDVLRKLDEVWCDALSNERHLVIGGTGSKMQNVGVLLFLVMHPECGLLHCEPSEFIASRYTSGIGPRWCLDFGNIDEIDRLLCSRGELRFRW